jgi:hypothetical protein
LSCAVAFGRSPVKADGGVKALVSTLEKPVTSIVLSLAIGLLLYLIDLPEKTRLYREGADGWRLPSGTLDAHMNSLDPPARRPVEDHDPKWLSVYFVLSDKYLPEETHRRIYLFGSLYRVYVDLRSLLAIGAVGGLAAAAVSASHLNGFDPNPPVPPRASAAICGLLLIVMAVGLVGVRAHAVKSRTKHTSEPDPQAASSFSERMKAELRAMLPSGLAMMTLGLIAGEALIRPALWLRLTGFTLLLIQLYLWFAVEIGPPKLRDGKPIDWRSGMLKRFGANDDRTQYIPLQRLLCDLALFGPWVYFGYVAYSNTGSSLSSLLAWGC